MVVDTSPPLCTGANIWLCDPFAPTVRGLNGEVQPCADVSAQLPTDVSSSGAAHDGVQAEQGALRAQCRDFSDGQYGSGVSHAELAVVRVTPGDVQLGSPCSCSLLLPTPACDCRRRPGDYARACEPYGQEIAAFATIHSVTIGSDWWEFAQVARCK